MPARTPALGEIGGARDGSRHSVDSVETAEEIAPVERPPELRGVLGGATGRIETAFEEEFTAD